MTTSSPTPGSTDGPVPGLAPAMLLYAGARLALVAVITAVLLVIGVPLAIAVLVGLIVALPLSMVLFRGLRTRLDMALAEAGNRRAAEREILRARLRGDDATPSASDPTPSDGAPSDRGPQPEPDGRGG